jgi:hypothetical protein
LIKALSSFPVAAASQSFNAWTVIADPFKIL